MSGLLEAMARASAERVAAARAREDEAALRRRAGAAPAPRPLIRHPGGFDVIAEYKRRSPSEGALMGEDEPPVYATAGGRARLYEWAGAACVSVLTEPQRFGGCLEDLEQAAEAIRVPAMRKDFLVDPYQVLEARAAGASGVLVIVRLVDDTPLDELLDAAADCGMFSLVEVFDEADAERARRVAERRGRGELLIGVNVRDLRSLDTDTGRLAALASSLPDEVPKVAESGLMLPEDAARAAQLGYRLGLVGTALMRARDPVTLLEAMVASARHVRRRG